MNFILPKVKNNVPCLQKLRKNVDSLQKSVSVFRMTICSAPKNNDTSGEKKV